MVDDSAADTGNHGVSAGDVPVRKELAMTEQIDVINMRLDFMSMVLSVLARSMSPLEAARAVRVIGERVIEQLGQVPEAAAEEAVVADLAPILAALQQR